LDTEEGAAAHPHSDLRECARPVQIQCDSQADSAGSIPVTPVHNETPGPSQDRILGRHGVMIVLASRAISSQDLMPSPTRRRACAGCRRRPSCALDEPRAATSRASGTQTRPDSPAVIVRDYTRGDYGARGRASPLTYSLGVAGALPLAFSLRAEDVLCLPFGVRRSEVGAG
jgi:hypothetical protein